MCGPATHMQVGVRLVPAIVVVTTEMLQMYHFWLADSPPELWVFSTNLFTLLFNSTLHARLLSRMHTHPSKHEFHEKRQQNRLMSHGVCFSPLKWFGVSTSLTVIELSTSVGVFLQLFPHCIHLSLSLSSAPTQKCLKPLFHVSQGESLLFNKTDPCHPRPYGDTSLSPSWKVSRPLQKLWPPYGHETNLCLNVRYIKTVEFGIRCLKLTCHG